MKPKFELGGTSEMDPALLRAVNATVRDIGLQIVFAGVRSLDSNSEVEDHISFSVTVIAALAAKIAMSVEDTLVSLEEVGHGMGIVTAEEVVKAISDGAALGVAESRKRREVEEGGARPDDKVH